jgi:small subunit ribosomal protein S19e
MGKTIYVQDAGKYIANLAEALKKIPEFEAPAWSGFVKSGVSKERPPFQEDFWHIRAASILRQLYIRGVVGVGKLRTRYGTKKDRGGKPDKFKKASGKIIRVILQQAGAAGLVEKMDRLQFGRRLTQKGRDLLDSIEVGEKVGMDLGDAVVKIVPKKEEDFQEENFEEKEASDVEEIKGADNSGDEANAPKKDAPSKESKEVTEVNEEQESKDGE